MFILRAEQVAWQPVLFARVMRWSGLALREAGVFAVADGSRDVRPHL